MFTGLIQETGRVTAMDRTRAGVNLTIEAPGLAAELSAGDSVCVAGACQTAVTVTRRSFTVTAIPETLKKTTFGSFAVGDRVNLELALRAGDRLGGHWVSGHVDTVGVVAERRDGSEGFRLTVSFPPEFGAWVLAQGSVAIDGVSLTVAERRPDALTVALIPETLSRTTLTGLRRGDQVNLEFDQMIKAVVQTVREYNGHSQPLTEKTLTRAGW